MSDTEQQSTLSISNYDINAMGMAQQPPLSYYAFTKALKHIRVFVLNQPDRYWMLLNRETYDFTLFDLGEKTDADITECILRGLSECLRHRGEVISIKKTEDNAAYEIWVKDAESEIESATDRARAYYFFPYDIGVIYNNKREDK